MLAWYRTFGPWLDFVFGCRGCQLDQQAVRIRKTDDFFAETLFRLEGIDVTFFEPPEPSSQEVAGIANVTASISPTPRMPRRASGHGKKVKIVPGLPTPSPK